jgi:diacylglycerol kinase
MNFKEKADSLLPKKVHHHSLMISFYYASQGLVYNFVREQNLRIQLSIGVFFSSLAIFYGHWILAMSNLILMGLVMSLEMLNTAFENLCDLVQPKFDQRVKVIKDTSAGAILLISLIWLLIIIYEILAIFIFKDNHKLFTL